LSRPTWRPPCGRARRLRVLRHASIRTLGEPALLWLGALWDPSFRTNRRRCDLRIGLSAPREWVDQVHVAQSPYARSEAIGHAGAVRLDLGGLRRDHHLLLCSSVSLLPLGRPASEAVGVTQRLVDLSAHPQTVQQHRELPRHGHHRPFLGVLAPAGGYLLPVAS
jgi:hypothetical protein